MNHALGKVVWSIPARVAIAGVMAYQAMIRPLLMGACKYCPSCSEYAIEALRTHGLVRGMYLAIARLVRCHPLAHGGYDPVPPGQCHTHQTG